VLGVAVPVLAGGEHGPVAVAEVPFVPVEPVALGVDVPAPVDEVVPGAPVAVVPVVPTPVEVVPVAVVPQLAVADGVVVVWLGVVAVVVPGAAPVD